MLKAINNDGKQNLRKIEKEENKKDAAEKQGSNTNVNRHVAFETDTNEDAMNEEQN